MSTRVCVTSQSHSAAIDECHHPSSGVRGHHLVRQDTPDEQSDARMPDSNDAVESARDNNILLTSDASGSCELAAFGTFPVSSRTTVFNANA